jgi:hypothetical protein
VVYKHSVEYYAILQYATLPPFVYVVHNDYNASEDKPMATTKPIFVVAGIGNGTGKATLLTFVFDIVIPSTII